MVNYKFLILAIFGTLFITYASSIPDITIVSSNDSLDSLVSNLAHVPVFACLSFFWFKAFHGSMLWHRKTFFVLIGLFLFSLSDEFHQSMVPGRTASFSDIILDFIGIILGFFAFRIFDRINRIYKLV
ncbi:VanZ family protein [Desulfosarcina ovata]|uniref:VanZ family protein n=1 Tax=Desulfosarcina ovata TaxID=83564 RepID=UPI0012D344DC|nr:VanZ family protein [Desulfosarcina ovata]